MAIDKKPKIRSEYKPTDKEAEALERVYDRYQNMKDAPDRIEAERKWDKAIKQWEAQRKDRERGSDWQSNHYVPLTTAVVETALAEIIDQTPQPLILPRSSEDQHKATVMSHIFRYTWDVADGDSELYNVEKDALIYGTGIAQEYYLKDRRLVRHMKLNKKGKEEFVEEEVFDYDDCYMETVKLNDFYVDEKARGFDGPYAARDCIRRYIMNIDDFKIFFTGDVWNPLENAKYVKPGGDTEYYEFYKPPQGIDHSKEVEVLWYWAKKPDDTLMIVANDVVIRNGPNIYRHKQLPFARVVDVKRPHSFYGKGEAEILESTQDEINTLRRMVIDRNHLDIDKMFLVSNNLGLNDEDLIARPHGLIPTDDVNAAKPVEYGDIPRSVEMSIKMLADDSTITTGIDPRSASLPTPGTATEAAILKESALKRIRMKMRLLEREFLVNVARLRVSNIIQFYSQPKLEKIVGKKGTQEYLQQVSSLASKGALEVVSGEPMKKDFKTIRLENKELVSDEKGVPKERAISGMSFFELRPEYFITTARGGYDIKFAAGSTLPISKPLMQSKMTEMYDRLIQLAVGGMAYDAEKLGDQLLRVNDLNPDDFKVEKAPTQELPEARAQQLVELAMRENELMIKGQQVAPTPFASPAHTNIHGEFMHSPTFQRLPNDSPVIQIFLDHVMGELLAQTGRTQAGTMTEGLPPRPQGQSPVESQRKALVGDQSGGNRAVQDTIPALIQGGGQIPTGI